MKNLKSTRRTILIAIANIKYRKSHNYKKEIEKITKELEGYFKLNGF